MTHDTVQIVTLCIWTATGVLQVIALFFAIRTWRLASRLYGASKSSPTSHARKISHEAS